MRKKKKTLILRNVMLITFLQYFYNKIISDRLLLTSIGGENKSVISSN